MTSRFSISTTSSSSTSSTCSYSPPVSPNLPTSSTLSPNASLSPTSRWPALSKDGLPRSSASSLTRPHRFHSPGTMTPPTRSPSPPTRCFTPPSRIAAATTTSASTHPTHPAATSAARRSSPPSPELVSRPLPPRNALGLVERGGSSSTATNNKRSKTAIVRMGRSMGRGLRQCSGFFKPRSDDPDDVDEVPKPVHWSEN